MGSLDRFSRIALQHNAERYAFEVLWMKTRSFTALLLAAHIVLRGNARIRSQSADENHQIRRPWIRNGGRIQSVNLRQQPPSAILGRCPWRPREVGMDHYDAADGASADSRVD